jgi:hypothetical protein
VTSDRGRMNLAGGMLQEIGSNVISIVEIRRYGELFDGREGFRHPIEYLGVGQDSNDV